MTQTPDQPTPPQASNESCRSIIRTVTSEALGWNPHPLPEPELADDFYVMVAVEKAAEILRLQTMRFEYGLSSNGILREWLRLVLRAAVFLGIPLLFLVPVLFYFFGSVTALSTLFVACILIVVIAAVPLLAVIIVARSVAVVFRGRRSDTKKK